MSVYHTLQWNFNELPELVLKVAKDTQTVLQEYIDAGHTDAEDGYWVPHCQDLMPKSGLRVRYRRWKSIEHCQEYVDKINCLRSTDPIKQLILSEAKVHNDNQFNPT